MRASYDDLKAAFLALQRLATVDRTDWLQGLAVGDPALHHALESFLAFEATPTSNLSLDASLDTGPDPLQGTRYEDRGQLGVGGIGEVRRVYDPSLDRVVALKMLRTPYAAHPDPARKEAAVRRFVTEAQIQASLNHPAILPVYERGNLPDGRPYLTMAVVHGETLGVRLRAVHAASESTWCASPDGWSFIGLIQAFELICRAVAHAHGQGLLHRDLKPSNVMVDGDGGATVLDWGLALPRDRGHLGSVAGTPGYMAPEQVDPDASLDERVDIYALGAILYAVLSGEDPHRGATPTEALTRLRQGVTPAPPGRVHGPQPPAALSSLCQRALSIEPTSRPVSAHAMADEVRSWLDAQGGRSSGPRRWVWGAGAGAILGISALALFSVLTGEGEEQDADKRLAGLRSSVARHVAADDLSAADLAFQSFVEFRGNLGTSALAEAWLDRAALHADRGLRVESRRALAMAYAEATEEAQRARALLAIAASQSADGAWRDLSATLDVLQSQHPVWADGPEGQDARWRLAIASRRFSTAGPGPVSGAADLEPLLSMVTRATALPAPTEPGERWFIPWGEGGGRPVGLAIASASGVAAVHLTDSGASLGPSRPWPHGWDAGAVVPLVVDDEPHLIVGQSGVVHLVRMGTAGTLQAVGSWRGPGPAWASAADLDGDGQDELWLALVAQRRIDHVSRDSAGVWTSHTPTGSVAGANSEVTGVVAADLDGDGEPELAASLGAWSAYDVRVLDSRSPGHLELVSRRRVGSASGMRRIRTPAGVELVVSVSERTPKHKSFGTINASNRAPGVYRFAVEAGELVDRGYAAVPNGRSPSHRTLTTLDLDGDGVDELAVQRGEDLWLGRFDGSGELVGVWIADLVALAAVDVDQDGDDELIVRDPTTGQSWALGTGLEALPARTWARRQRPEAAVPGWLATQGDRAGDLFTMGLAQQGADTLARLAELYESPAERAVALTRAALLHELDGRLREAMDLYERAAEQGVEATDARRGSARCAARLHEFGVSPTWSLDVRGQEMRQAAQVDSLGVRSPPVGGGLELRALADEVLLRVPLERTGDRLGIEVEGELHELTWSSGISFEVHAIAEPSHGLYASVHGHGGGGQVETRVSGGCGFERAWAKSSARDAHRPAFGAFRVRVDCDGSSSHGVFELHGLGQTSVRELDYVSPTTEGGYELIIRGRTGGRASLLPTRLTLTHLRLHGVTQAQVTSTPVVRAAQELVRGRPDAALMQLDESESSIEASRLRAVAWGDLGRSDRAFEALQWTRSVDDSLWSKRALRLRPALSAEVARTLGPGSVPLLWQVWRTESQLDADSADVVRALTEGPLGTLPLAGVDRDLAAEIRLARGRAWWRSGGLARARQELSMADEGEDRAVWDLGTDPAVDRAKVAIAMQDLPAALEQLRLAVSRGAAPELVLDRLAEDPDFAAARADPSWPALARLPFTPAKTTTSEAK